MNIAAEQLQELGALLQTHPLILVGVLLISGYFAGKLFKRLGMPEVVGFIFAGLVVNGMTSAAMTKQLNQSLHIVTEVAIGLLAMSVGAEFSLRKLRRIARDVLVVTLAGLLFTFTLVLFACIGFNRLFPRIPVGYPHAILLAVIACATAPAIIMAEVHHLRAQGRFVDYLFGVVALGDAFSVIIFGLAFSVVSNILAPEGTPVLTMAASLREIGFSLVAGAGAGVLLHLLAHRIRNSGELLIIAIGMVFALTGLCAAAGLSPLLANMLLGAVLINLSPRNHRMFREMEPLTPPIYALFFVIAGIELTPAVFLRGNVFLAGAFFILVRGAARYLGTYAGCALRGLATPIKRNLGNCMLSQGGVALGFVLLIQTSPLAASLLQDEGQAHVFTLLVNIVLVSVFVNELISPFFLRRAIIRGNEMEDI